MFQKRKKNIKKKIKKHIHKPFHKHIHKHVHRAIHTVHHVHHWIMHSGELVFVMIFSLGGIMFASFNTAYEEFHRANSQEVASHLVKAMDQGKPKTNASKIISAREMDRKVANTFAPGYCTYGAARISPEFFPYTDEFTQQRTWGGNAIDRCENASATGFSIGKAPSVGALIVYKQGGSISVFGHVGKVMFHNAKENKIIVRDMNRIGKDTMTDRWEDTTSPHIKCYIYPKKTTNTTPIEKPIEQKPLPEKFPEIIVIAPEPSKTTTGTINNTNTIKTGNTLPTHNSAPTNTGNTQPTPPIEIQKPESTIQIPTPQPPLQLPQTTEDKIVLNLDNQNLSDEVKLFIEQNTIEIKIMRTTTFTTHNNFFIQVEIKNKQTGENYNGLLPFLFDIIPINTKIKAEINKMQIINNGNLTIQITPQEIGKSGIIFNIDDQKIGDYFLTIE